MIYFEKVFHTYFHWLHLPPNLTYGTWTRTENLLAFDVGDATIYKKKERKMEQIFGKRWIHIGAHFNAQNYIYGKRDIDLNHFYLLLPQGYAFSSFVTFSSYFVASLLEFFAKNVVTYQIQWQLVFHRNKKAFLEPYNGWLINHNYLQTVIHFGTYVYIFLS